MKLSFFREDDEPLFYHNDGEEGKEVREEKLSLEEYNSCQDNERKNKVLEFCFAASIWILILIIVLIIADFFAQEHKLERDLLHDCLSLVTYTMTAALGFMFGSNTK